MLIVDSPSRMIFVKAHAVELLQICTEEIAGLEYVAEQIGALSIKSKEMSGTIFFDERVIAF